MISSDTDYDTKITLEAGGMLLPEEPPFHILLLGDWSGKGSCSDDSDLSKLKPLEIDRDNFEEVLEKLKVRADLDFQGGSENTLSLDFNGFDDFHPDKIFQNLPLFSELRDVRRRLVNSDTFEIAAREVRSWFVEDDNAKEPALEPLNSSTEISQNLPDNLLDEILGQSVENAASSQKQTTQTTELNTFIKNIVKPHLIQTDSEEQSKLLMVVDEVISDLMRKILHHPKFKVLESSWRGLYFLVRRVETNTNLKFFLADVSKEELKNNLKSVSDLTDSKLYKLLTQDKNQFVENKPWAIIGGNFDFSLNIDDVATLIRVAKIANDMKTPFISSITPEMFGFKSFGLVDDFTAWKVTDNSVEDKLWTMLRSIPEAVSLGLVMPRFLSRLPYGEKTEPIEAFYFEEFTDIPPHEKYLWSNSVFIAALLFAQTFSQHGWDFSNNLSQNLDGMLIHLYKVETENKTQPATEISMTQNNCETILDQGLMPVISFKNTDRVRLMGFQSISSPLSLLKGRWK